MTAGESERRDAIRRVLRTKRVGTQEELRTALAAAGIAVTQATLSRDLARLGARRVTFPDVGSVYEIDGFPVRDAAKDLARVGDLVMSIGESVALVVVLTTPGAAAAVALAIDRARMPEILATIAGDDTIFVAPARKGSPAALAKKLRRVWNRQANMRSAT